MSSCPICRSDLADCTCGYDPASGEIEDWSRAQRWIFDRQAHWAERLNRLEACHGWQMQKHGQRSTDAARGWSIRQTGRYLKRSLAQMSDDFRLIALLKKYPDCRHLENKSHAVRKTRELEALHPIYGIMNSAVNLESKLQAYLEKNWESTPFAKLYELVRRGKFPAGECGEIDLLAKHKSEDSYLVIELKRDMACDVTIGQILRYIGWVKLNLASENTRVEGVLILGPGRYNADPYLRFALASIPHVSAYEYMQLHELVIFTDCAICRTRSEFENSDKNLPTELRRFLTLSDVEREEYLRRLKDTITA